MSRISLLSSVAVCTLIAAPVCAQDSGTFTLGKIEQITVTGQKMDQANMSEGLITNEDMYKFDTQTLDKAIDLIAGATSLTSGGTRNEQLIYVRGFDRFETPLLMDGIRVYLPADNRLDFGMFLTADIAGVQVEKGYASVLDGPGAMGGAINLVTRKPTQPFEWEARVGTEFGGDGSLNGETAYLMAGTKQDKYYLEASGALDNQTRWSLSDNYTPTATENSGFRDHSF